VIKLTLVETMSSMTEEIIRAAKVDRGSAAPLSQSQITSLSLNTLLRVMASPAGKGTSDDEEDDYMSMVIAEPTRPDKESSIQRVARRKKEVDFTYTRPHRYSEFVACEIEMNIFSLPARPRRFWQL
jgi:hypothetical protein